ncbi:hypothetical protein SAMN05216489_04128 [Streptomyces sp. 3213]|nr:hypothetical protein SAMN05216489_04128 [Streptomyces sp. 3213] [Streptomyces sp. 3213.3]
MRLETAQTVGWLLVEFAMGLRIATSAAVRTAPLAKWKRVTAWP